MQKVNILGTEYTIEVSKEKDSPKLKMCDGYVDWTIKKIVVGEFESDINSLENLGEYTKKVMRHEIVHAFLIESGLWECSRKESSWARSEEMTDWIARQFHKMADVFKRLDI